MAVALVASGCAAHRVPDRIVSTDWAAIASLPRGTEVSVWLDGDEVRHGRVHESTVSALTLWERNGADLIPRGRIARVSRRVDLGTSRASGFIHTTIAAAAISGVLGAVIAAMGENGLTKDDGVVVFAVGTLAGAALGASRQPSQKYEDRLIYIRP